MFIFGCTGSSLLLHGRFLAVAGGVLFTAVSQRGAFCGAQALGAGVSVVVAYRPGCSAACGDLPRPGLEPMFPALAGRFLPTAPPGKSL